MKRSSTPPPNFPNNSSLLHTLVSSPSSLVKPRRRVSSHPVFPSALPSFESITRSASAQATILKPQREPERTQTLEEELDEILAEAEVPASVHRRSSSTTSQGDSEPRSRSSSTSTRQVTKKPAEAFELFRAIEKKDVMRIMEIRDTAFPLRGKSGWRETGWPATSLVLRPGFPVPRLLSAKVKTPAELERLEKADKKSPFVEEAILPPPCQTSLVLLVLEQALELAGQGLIPMNTPALARPR
ncbi:hypothetical protein BT69DRAFT_1346711 [Atractiella rhizophila]|nr:hypothetical protein BT69DRAFT_1346711 [Atractiella rhizophila]